MSSDTNANRPALTEINANQHPGAGKTAGKKRHSDGQDDTIKSPPVKKARAPPKSTKSNDKSNDNKKTPDVNDIVLDGEKEDRVEVYDTCDEIRRKITAHQKKYGVSMAEFGREIGKCIHTRGSTHVVPGARVTGFRQKKGVDAGNTSDCFYASYVYFEKLRIKENKPKSKHREKMEETWGAEGGFDIKTLPSNKFFWHSKDETPYTDQYGYTSIL